MSKQTINIGIRANDGRGDSLRVAFTKTNNNFTELYTSVQNNANTSNTYYVDNQNLAQGAFDKANTVFLGDIKFQDKLMYSNTTVEVGNDPHNRKAWIESFGQVDTQANNAFANGVAYDQANNILVAMTTQNETTGLPQSTVIKYDAEGNIFWRRSVPAINVSSANGYSLMASYGEAVTADANNNVYLLTNVPGDFSTMVTKFNYLGQNVWSTYISDSIGSKDICVDDEDFPYYVGEHNTLTGLDITGELYFTKFASAAANAHVVMAMPKRFGVLTGTDNGQVHKHTTEGVYVSTNNVNAAGNKIIALSYDSSNNYFVATNTNIYKFAPNNSLIWEKELTGLTPEINWIKQDNSYLYVSAYGEVNGDDSLITYKIGALAGDLQWTKALAFTGANTNVRLGHRQLDVKGNYMIGSGYGYQGNSNVAIGLTYQLPTDNSLAGTYYGVDGSTWGDFKLVFVPEAQLSNSTTVGTGNTTVTIADNSNYSYTMNVIHYENPSPENEERVTRLNQKWDFGANGSILLPSSGDPIGIDFSGKTITKVGSVSFADGTTQETAFNLTSSVPATAKGTSGDKSGHIAANSTYIYFCTTDYTNGVANIWKRVAWSNDTW